MDLLLQYIGYKVGFRVTKYITIEFRSGSLNKQLSLLVSHNISNSLGKDTNIDLDFNLSNYHILIYKVKRCQYVA